jgi:hypothetical protein
MYWWLDRLYVFAEHVETRRVEMGGSSVSIRQTIDSVKLRLKPLPVWPVSDPSITPGSVLCRLKSKVSRAWGVLSPEIPC